MKATMVVDATKTTDDGAVKQDIHQHALFDAISKSDLEAVKKILKEESEWQNLRDDMNRTPLMTACLYDNTEVVAKIIEALDDKCSEINKSTTPSRNPAMESPEMKKLLKSLVFAGQKVRKIEMRKHTALVIASEEGHLSILQLLVNHGADINQNDGSTALRSACMRGHLECVEYLLENFADPSLVNKDTTSTPLIVAVMIGSEDIVAVLLKHGNNGLNTAVTGCEGLTALHVAAARRNSVIFGMLLQHGANIHAISKRGWTALDHAVIRRSMGIPEASLMVDMLLARGAKVPTGTFCAASLWVVGYDLSRHFGQVACGRSLQKRWIDRYQWRYGHIPHCYVDGARPSGNLPAVVILLLLHSTLNFGYGWCCYCCFYPPLELLLQSLIVMITILILKKIGITIVMVMKEYMNNRMDSEYVCENDFIGERRIYMLGRRGEDQYLNTSID